MFPWAYMKWDGASQNALYTYGGLTASTGLLNRVLSWDDMIMPYLGQKFTETEMLSLTVHSVKVMLCPSDPFFPDPSWGPTAQRRSYAMVTRRGSFAESTPFDPNQTGAPYRLTLGMGDTINTQFIGAGVTSAVYPTCFKASNVRRSSETIWVSERHSTLNILGTDGRAIIDGPCAQMDFGSAPGSTPVIPVHQRRFNYLFVDGHVDGLTPTQTIGADSHGNGGNGSMGGGTAAAAVYAANGWTVPVGNANGGWKRVN
jgi:prepilin-type processing-associated H-X9-DG protein